jgi:hypothetical protein
METAMIQHHSATMHETEQAFRPRRCTFLD